MAKLERITNKIFGQDANSTGTNPAIGQFGAGLARTFVGTQDIKTIQQLPAWSRGWIDAVSPQQQFPALPEMTGVMKVLSYQTAYLAQEGIPEYDEGTIYFKGSMVKDYNDIDTIALYFSITDENQGNPLSDTTHWQRLKIGDNGAVGGEYNLFDIVVKDYELSPDESVGMAKLGTYVNKNGAPGSQVTYEDFYNKCLSEYQNATTTSQVINYNKNLTLLGTASISPTGLVTGIGNANHDTDFDNVINAVSLNPIWQNFASYQYWELNFDFYTPRDVKTTGSKPAYNILLGGSEVNHPKIILTAKFQLLTYLKTSSGSNILNGVGPSTTLTGNTWYKLKLYRAGTTFGLNVYNSSGTLLGSYSNTVAGVTNVYVGSSSTSLYLGRGIRKAGAIGTFNGLFNVSTMNLKYGSSSSYGSTIDTINTITYKKAPNGHKFYDISQKATFDNLYNNTGVSWFYGVDTNNERIFLPRNDYIFQNTKGYNVGDSIAPTLPNFKGYGVSGSDGAIGSVKNALEYIGSVNAGKSGNDGEDDAWVLDPHRGNWIYQDGATVRMPGVKVFQYMVVGVTEVINKTLDYVDRKLGTFNEEIIEEVASQLDNKQDVLTPGDNIDISEDNIISVSEDLNVPWGNISGSIDNQEDLQNALSEKQDTLIPGTNITIENNVISATGEVTTSVSWGDITGDIENQGDLTVLINDISTGLNDKQDTLIPGLNINISENNVISERVPVNILTGDTIELIDNSVNKLVIEDATTFILPEIVDTTEYHQILVQITMDNPVAIDLGTVNFFYNETPDLSSAGQYDIIYEFDGVNWVVGVLPVGVN